MSETDATHICTRLAASLAYQHQANSGAWGHHWQSALWTSLAASAAWFLQDSISASDMELVKQMVADEADWQLTRSVGWWYDRSGTELSAGDTKADENAWNSMVFQAAICMMPNHPNKLDWYDRCRFLMKAAYARPADLASDSSLNGYNMLDNGILENHDIIHPDYFVNPILNMQAVVFWSLIGEPAPDTATHNAHIAYDALTDVTFASPPYDSPGGTCYISGSDALYYPEGTDWGTDRRMNFACFDAFADSFQLAPTSTPSTWAQLHADAALAMQARDTTGQTYQAGDSDVYSGREQWVGIHAAWAWLARWIVATGKYTP